MEAGIGARFITLLKMPFNINMPCEPGIHPFSRGLTLGNFPVHDVLAYFVTVELLRSRKSVQGTSVWSMRKNGEHIAKIRFPAVRHGVSRCARISSPLFSREVHGRFLYSRCSDRMNKERPGPTSREVCRHPSLYA